MHRFFGFFAFVCLSLLFSVIALGHFPTIFAMSAQQHMLLGLLAGILTISLHCLIFAIFTGSGKDVRELAQERGLESQFIKRTKAFKKTVFPPALYAICLVVLTTTLGGALAVTQLPARILHIVLAWLTFLYNLKTCVLEYRAVKENREIIDAVNRLAAGVASGNPVEVNSTDQNELGLTIHALGKFLIFLGYNVWLPYLYLRFSVGLFRLTLWPFLAISLLLLSGGYYLKWRYREYRPEGPFGHK